MDKHTCTVCFDPSDRHEAFDGCCEKLWFPPLCCDGCQCKSFETAHAEPAEQAGQ